MNISKLFCMLIAGLAIIGFTTLGYASQEEASHADEIKSEAASELENAEEQAAQSAEDIQYGAKSNLESDGEEAEAAKAEEKE